MDFNFTMKSHPLFDRQFALLFGFFMWQGAFAMPPSMQSRVEACLSFEASDGVILSESGESTFKEVFALLGRVQAPVQSLAVDIATSEAVPSKYFAVVPAPQALALAMSRTQYLQFRLTSELQEVTWPILSLNIGPGNAKSAQLSPPLRLSDPDNRLCEAKLTVRYSAQLQMCKQLRKCLLICNRFGCETKQ